MLEEVINARLVALPLADYMTLERLLIEVQKMLRNEEYSENPERASGVPYLWKRELVYNLSELYGKEYGDPLSGVIMNLAKIYVGESHQSALEKWVKDSRKRFQTLRNFNAIASKENKIHDKYYR